MLMICEESSYLVIEQTVSYNRSNAPKIHIFNSEFSYSVLLILLFEFCAYLMPYLSLLLYAVAFIELTKECV
jgi:hypothetical protein